MAKITQVAGKDVKVHEVKEEAEKPAVPQAPVGTPSGKAKKNQSITVQYLDKDGGEVGLGEDVTAVKVITKAGEKLIQFSQLPKPMLIAAVAFGLNTTFRNAHNSAENGGKDGIAAVNARISGILSGEWRAIGDGEDDSVPLVILAMIRAKQDAKVYTANMEDKWLAEYRSLDKDGKATWTKTYSAKKPIEIALLKIKAERAAAKAAKVAGSGEGTDADF